MQRFSGRVALVTGAGLGEATAHRFAAEGACVLVLDLQSARFVTGHTLTVDGGLRAAGVLHDLSEGA